LAVNTFDAVFYTLSFIVPGFIWNSTLFIFVPRRAEETGTVFLRYLTLSCLNYAIWIWLIYLVVRSEFFAQRPVWSAFAWFLIIFISPVLLGVITGRLSSQDWLRRLLIRLGLGPIHPIPTAWDYYFSRTAPVWVLATLKDGSHVAGFFGRSSFASSDPRERDLYLEKIFKIVENGPWETIPRNRGILISGNQIASIEFWETEEEAHNGERN
jgi:hypothetical protein